MVSVVSVSVEASEDALDSSVTSSVASEIGVAAGCAVSEARASAVAGGIGSELPARAGSFSGFWPSSPRRRKMTKNEDTKEEQNDERCIGF